MRHDAAGDYVFVLQVDAIQQRRVKTGNSSVTRISVLEGLSENDVVAMPSDTALTAGMKVTPVIEPRL
jgi:hypothetical protein